MGEVDLGQDLYSHQRRDDLVRFLSDQGLISGRILDVGCAAGLFGERLLEMGAGQVIGVEPLQSRAVEAATRLTRVLSETFPVEHLEALGTFDLVVFADSLEHMLDPWASLKAARALLHPHGAVLLSVPNVSHWTVLWAALKLGEWEYQAEGILDRTHLRFFTPKSIGRTLAECGYAVVAEGFDPDAYPLPQKRRWMRPLMRRFAPHTLIYQYLVLARPVER